ncbi:hypothetical protein PGB90_001470 [Kerria lacca]
MNRNILIFLITISFYEFCFCYPQCLNENGEVIDWFVIYKLPKIKDHPNYKIAQGIAYMYITSETVKQGWKYGKYSITHSKSMVGQTLFVKYPLETNNVNDIFWVYYNDQPPNQKFTYKEGHTKGIVIGNNDGGFWMVHSVPKFPMINTTSYKFPMSGTVYGQSFLCISMLQGNLNEVGDQLITNCANVFDSKFTPDLNNLYPALIEAANKERRKIIRRKKIIVSSGGTHFISFAKSSKFGKDLYSKWINEDLFTQLYVETWLHEGKLSSDCNDTYAVYNVRQISIDFLKCKFNNYKDHSKYAVSIDEEKPWVCIGDINRANTQYIRGGGTVCTKDKDLWLLYYKIISSVEPCYFQNINFSEIKKKLPEVTMIIVTDMKMVGAGFSKYAEWEYEKN